MGDMGDHESREEQRARGKALTLPPVVTVDTTDEAAPSAEAPLAATQPALPAASQPSAALTGAPISVSKHAPTSGEIVSALPTVSSAPATPATPAKTVSELPTAQLGPNMPQSPQMVDRARAQTFSKALRILLQRQGYYVALTETYLLPQFYDRLRTLDGTGIQIASLRAYLRGETLPSEVKTRLIADALGAPRGLLLYVAGYLTPEDLAHYPGPQLTLATVEADISELEDLPLAAATKARIARDLRISARILCLLAPDRIGLVGSEGRPAADGAATLMGTFATAPDEREMLIEQLIDLWATPAPPVPSLTSVEEGARSQQR
ncbi:MAG TPA: hypothetical protein VKQ36_15875 [Ktedonobacterales bacterium]|nr:hypothetical protein [Ktedonobacterales bacterium]